METWEREKQGKKTAKRKKERNWEYLDLTVQARGKINGARRQQLGKVAYGVNRNKPCKLVRLLEYRWQQSRDPSPKWHLPLLQAPHSSPGLPRKCLPPSPVQPVPCPGVGGAQEGSFVGSQRCGVLLVCNSRIHAGCKARERQGDRKIH